MSNDKDGTGVPVLKQEEPDNSAGNNRNRFQRNRRGFNNNCNNQQQRQHSRFEGREPSLKGYI
jgi:hypothetical protein